MAAPPPGYLEEGLLHSEAGQQNWWTSSASSSSLENGEGTDKQTETDYNSADMPREQVGSSTTAGVERRWRWRWRWDGTYGVGGIAGNFK